MRQETLNKIAPAILCAVENDRIKTEDDVIAVIRAATISDKAKAKLEEAIAEAEKKLEKLRLARENTV